VAGDPKIHSEPSIPSGEFSDRHTSGLAFERFQVDGREEWLMRLGRPHAPAILFVPPLFEEMNRTRALLVAAMRRLARGGQCCWLLDLSGTGESERDLSEVSWDDWRHDVTAAAFHIAERSKKPLIASIRSGALLDDGAVARGWWRFAPQDGAALVRDMVRAGLAGVEWAGYAPSDPLKGALEAAKPAAVRMLRTVRLASDRGEADAKLEGPALWRRSEPGISDELAAAIAADLQRWSRECVGF
jgi:alpha-beta hydrolase superfamily lysophospholipase